MKPFASSSMLSRDGALVGSKQDGQAHGQCFDNAPEMFFGTLGKMNRSTPAKTVAFWHW